MTNKMKLFMLAKFLRFLTLDEDQITLPQLAQSINVNFDDPVNRRRVIDNLNEILSKWFPRDNNLKLFQSNHHDRASRFSSARVVNAAENDALVRARNEIKRLEKLLVHYQKQTASSNHQRLQAELHQLKIKNQTLIGDRDQAVKKVVELQNQVQTQKTELAESQKRLDHHKNHLSDQIVKIGQFDPQMVKKYWIKTNSSILEGEIKRQFNQIRQRWSKQLTELAQKELLDAMERNAPLVAKNRTVVEFKIDNLSKNPKLRSHIIGRSGQNIQTFESVTGVELIINKQKICFSSFNPMKKQIAYNALTELVRRDKFSPTWIKKIVQECQEKMDQEIIKIGQATVKQFKLAITHSRLLYLIGKLKFRSGYNQEVLKHSVEVAHFAGQIAGQLGLDVQIARRAGLLHDIGKALDREEVGNHVEIGVRIAEECGESPTIINAIHAHHNDVAPTTPYANIVKIADTLSAARFGARSNSKEDFVSRINALEEMIKSNFSGIKNVNIYQAGREINVVVDPERVNDLQACQLSAEIFRKITDEVKTKANIIIPGDINITILRTKTFLRTVRS